MSRIYSTPSTVNHSPQKHRTTWIALTGAIALGSIIGIPMALDAHTYKQGEQDYQAAQCEEAIARFDRLIQRFRVVDGDDYVARAEAKKVECENFLTISADSTSQRADTTLLNYHSFLLRYPGSTLTDSIQKETGALIEQTPSDDLISLGLCDQLHSVQSKGLIPNPDLYLPDFYVTCADIYETAHNYAGAIAFYEQILDDYPDHEQAEIAEAGLARSMVAQATEEGSGTIEPPPLVGSTSDGTTVVMIQNDSPEPMRIVFSGPQPRFEELPACENCQSYAGEGPEFCPEQGPVGTYTLLPGDYSILVRSTSDRAVTPYTGEWQLNSRSEYYTCFLIVQQPQTES